MKSLSRQIGGSLTYSVGEWPMLAFKPVSSHQSSDSLCPLFKSLAHWTMAHMTKAWDDDLLFGETTVTECILFMLKQIAPANFDVTAFGLEKEKVYGADYEFVFCGPTRKRWIAVRLQAKRLYNQSRIYEQLKGRQSEQWKKLASFRHEATPLFVFYNSEKIRGLPKDFKQQDSMDWGCSISPITAVLPRKKASNSRKMRNQRGYRKPSNINPMTPWHNLVCSNSDKDGQPKELPDIVSAKLEKLYSEDEKEDLKFDCNVKEGAQGPELLSFSQSEERRRRVEREYLKPRNLTRSFLILQSELKKPTPKKGRG